MAASELSFKLHHWMKIPAPISIPGELLMVGFFLAFDAHFVRVSETCIHFVANKARRSDSL